MRCARAGRDAAGKLHGAGGDIGAGRHELAVAQPDPRIAGGDGLVACRDIGKHQVQRCLRVIAFQDPALALETRIAGGPQTIDDNLAEGGRGAAAAAGIERVDHQRAGDAVQAGIAIGNQTDRAALGDAGLDAQTVVVGAAVAGIVAGGDGSGIDQHIADAGHHLAANRDAVRAVATIVAQGDVAGLGGDGLDRHAIVAAHHIVIEHGGVDHAIQVQAIGVGAGRRRLHPRAPDGQAIDDMREEMEVRRIDQIDVVERKRAGILHLDQVRAVLHLVGLLGVLAEFPPRGALAEHGQVTTAIDGALAPTDAHTHHTGPGALDADQRQASATLGTGRAAATAVIGGVTRAVHGDALIDHQRHASRNRQRPGQERVARTRRQQHAAILPRTRGQCGLDVLGIGRRTFQCRRELARASRVLGLYRLAGRRNTRLGDCTTIAGCLGDGARL